MVIYFIIWFFVNQCLQIGGYFYWLLESIKRMTRKHLISLQTRKHYLLTSLMILRLFLAAALKQLHHDGMFALHTNSYLRHPFVIPPSSSIISHLSISPSLHLPISPSSIIILLHHSPSLFHLSIIIQALVIIPPLHQVCILNITLCRNNWLFF